MMYLNFILIALLVGFFLNLGMVISNQVSRFVIIKYKTLRIKYLYWKYKRNKIGS